MGLASIMPLLARLGYGARGLAYLAAGLLSLDAALGAESDPVGVIGAVRRSLTMPLGWLWPLTFGVGFAAFAAWRLTAALTDFDGVGNGWLGWRIRGAQALGSIVYAGLALASAALASGLVAPDKASDALAKQAVAMALTHPLGEELVSGFGLAVATGGLFLIWRALLASEVPGFLAAEPAPRGWALMLGRFGFAARGIALTLVGGSLGLAGWSSQAGSTRGVAGALMVMEAWPLGWLALAAVACGFLAFGLFSLAQASSGRAVRPLGKRGGQGGRTVACRKR